MQIVLVYSPWKELCERLKPEHWWTKSPRFMCSVYHERVLQSIKCCYSIFKNRRCQINVVITPSPARNVWKRAKLDFNTKQDFLLREPHVVVMPKQWSYVGITWLRQKTAIVVIDMRQTSACVDGHFPHGFFRVACYCSGNLFFLI